MKKIIVIILLTVIIALFFYKNGNENYILAEILSKQIDAASADSEQMFDNTVVYDLKIKVLSGKLSGQIMFAKHYVSSVNPLLSIEFEAGDKVTAQLIEEENGELSIGIDDYYKTNKILFVLILFVILIFLVTGYKGLKSLVALLLTLVLIFGWMSELLLKGYPPIQLAVIFSFVITIITLTIVSGINKKTYASIIGVCGGVLAAGIFGFLSVKIMRLSGYTGHESMQLQYISNTINLQGILVCGIIIGALGAVMDVSVSIAASIAEIKEANNEYGFKKLFLSGIKIGKDIIGTMTNTLALAYAGSSFTLILLFTSQKEDFPLSRIINMEFIASEIVRSIAGSFGMVLAIPLTAAAAAYLFRK